jgi:hypothetical protein
MQGALPRARDILAPSPGDRRAGSAGAALPSRAAARPPLRRAACDEPRRARRGRPDAPSLFLRCARAFASPPPLFALLAPSSPNTRPSPAPAPAERPTGAHALHERATVIP